MERREKKFQKRGMLFWVGCVVCLAGACASAPDTKVDPVAKCYEVRDVYCSRSDTCNQAGAAPSANYFMDCKSDFATKTDCSKFTKVIGHPDACIDDVTATPCTNYNADTAKLPLPASCASIKLFK
jgi:hypothetical protein